MALLSPLTIAPCRCPGGIFADERNVEKRYSRVSCHSQARDYKLGKNGRIVHVLATRSSDWMVSSTTSASDVNSIPYIVKDGDTLTSIARQSKTSVRILADANSIADVNFLLSGQLLHIPTESERHSNHTVGDDEFPIPRGYAKQSSFSDSTQSGATKSWGGSQKVEDNRLTRSVWPTSVNFPKLAVPVLLMAPLLGFCIRCIVDSIYIHMDREEGKEKAKMEAWETMHRPKAERWQKILEEDRDTDQSRVPGSEGSAARNTWGGGEVWDQDANVRETTRENTKAETDEEIRSRHKQDYEDIRNSYVELESSYMKFLIDSGMSKSGYWRGSGVSTSARLDDGEAG